MLANPAARLYQQLWTGIRCLEELEKSWRLVLCEVHNAPQGYKNMNTASTKGSVALPIKYVVLGFCCLSSCPLAITTVIIRTGPEPPQYRSFTFFDERSRSALRKLHEDEPSDKQREDDLHNSAKSGMGLSTSC